MNIYAGLSEEREYIYKAAIEEVIRNEANIIIPDDWRILDDIQTLLKNTGLLEMCSGHIFSWADVNETFSKEEKEDLHNHHLIYLLPEMIVAEAIGLTDENSYWTPDSIYFDTDKMNREE